MQDKEYFEDLDDLEDQAMGCFSTNPKKVNSTTKIGDEGNLKKSLESHEVEMALKAQDKEVYSKQNS